MVISQPPENNPSYYYRASQALPQLLWMLQRHLMFYTCNYNIRVTHRNGAIKHIFYTNQIHGGIISVVLYSFCRSMRLLFILAVKYYFKSFCMKIWARWPYIHLSVEAPLQNANRTALCYAAILLSGTFLIFDANHQQNTRRSDQIETIKTIMQTTRLVSHGRFYQWLRLPF